MIHKLCYSLVALLLLAAPALAQEASSPSVSGVGTATIKRPTNKLRMTMVLTARGKTLDEALGGLKDRKTAVALQLKKLQAEQESIEFGETAIAPEGQERNEVQRMMQMRSARGGKPPKGLELPKQATVTSTLHVDWPLKYDSHEALLIAVKQLQDQIAAADLAGLKEPKKLSPEEAELEEELAGAEEQYDPYGNRQQAPPGHPSYSYIAIIKPEERTAALAEAFAQAKTKAGQLAAAAGSQLGSLIELNSQGEGAIDEVYNPYEQYARQMAMGDAKEGEATSASPGLIASRFTIQAKFRITAAEAK